MAKNSKVKEVSVSTHNGNHFVTVVRERTDGGKRMYHTSTSFVSIYSVQRAQRAQLMILPQVQPWQEKCNAWRRNK